jgi:hypothetical protein
MVNNIESKVKELVTDFKLDEALDLLIAQAQTQNQRMQNALLVLKGKLAMLEEQALSGILDPADVARQKAAIAHQLLDIADGSPLDHEPPPMPAEPQVLVQKTVRVPTAQGGSTGKYLLFGGLLVAALVAGFFFAKSCGNSKEGTAHKTQSEQTTPASPTVPNGQTTAEGATSPVSNNNPNQPAANQNTSNIRQPGSRLVINDFPNLSKGFNFLDLHYTFFTYGLGWVSDTEIKLTVKSGIACRSNIGICYRANLKVYADGVAISPSYQKDLLGWYEHKASVNDEVQFILPANAQSFAIELSRDNSTWKRPFKILSGK